MRVRPALEQLAAGGGRPRQAGGDPARPAGAGHDGGRGLRPHRGASATGSRGEVREAFRTGRAWWTSTRRSTRPRPKLPLTVDREKAALHGVRRPASSRRSAAAGQGAPLGTFHVQRGAAQVPVVLQLAPGAPEPPRHAAPAHRAGRARAGAALGAGPCGAGAEPPEIQHKNLMPVTYVFGDLAGADREPGLRARGAEPRSSTGCGPGRRGGAALRPLPAAGHRARLHQVGRRVAHHAGGLPRPRPGLRGGAGAHLRAGGGLVPELQHAAGDPGAHPASPHRHPPGPRACSAPSSPPPA